MSREGIATEGELERSPKFSSYKNLSRIESKLNQTYGIETKPKR